MYTPAAAFMSPIASNAATSAASLRIAQLSLQYSSLALVWYDYCLTFSLEVEHVWKAGLRWSTISYVFMRYPLVDNTLYLFAITGHLTENCDTWYKFIGALSVFGRAAVLAVYTLRTTAIYHGSKYVFAFLSLQALACIALDIAHVPGERCRGSVAIPIVNTMLYVVVTVFELSVAVLLSVRAFKVLRGGHSILQGGLMPWVLKEGLLYFCGVFGFQMAEAVLSFVESTGEFKRLVNAFALSISCLLTARFLLNIRELQAREAGVVSSSILDDSPIFMPVSSLAFAESYTYTR